MSRFFSVFSLGLCLAAAGLASPVTYNIAFTSAIGLLPTSGGFIYDSANAASPFSSFVVVWDGITFDLTSVANTGGLSMNCDASQNTPPNLATNILFQSFASPCTNVGYAWFALNGGTPNPASFEFDASRVIAPPAFPGGFPTTSDAVISAGAPGLPATQGGQGGFSISAVPEPASIYGVSSLWAIGWIIREVSRRRRSNGKFD
jgi:hypothetical protein